MFLGGVERVEDSLLHVCRHTHARIGHGNLNVQAGVTAVAKQGIVFLEQNVFCGDMDASALRHRIPGIHTEVHQHLVELRGITDHRPEIIGHSGLNLDGSVELLLENCGDLTDEMGGRGLNAVPFITAGEGEHLLDQVRAALGGGFHRIQPAQPFAVIHAQAQKLRGENDGRQHVVQIVRNAAGQRAQAFQALGAEKVRFTIFLSVTSVLMISWDFGLPS